MWHDQRIDELADIVSGGTPSREVPEYWGGEVAWVTPSDITKCQGNYLSVTEEKISQLGLRNSSAKMLPKGAVLFTSRATIGESRLAKKEVCTNQGFKSLVSNSGTDSLFLYYSVLLNVSKFKRYAIGSTFPEINKKDMARVEISIPIDVKEQQKISGIIESADKAIDKTQALIAKYENIKQGMMQDLFTRGVDENGQLRPSYEEAPHLYQETELGWIPKDWEVASFLDLLDQKVISEVQDGNHGEQHPKSSEFVEDGVPFIMANDISKYGDIDFESCSRITEKQYRSLRIGFSKAGDVLLTHKGTIGRVSVVPNEVMELMLTPQVTYYRVSDKKRLSPHYLAYFLSSPLFQSILQGLSAQSTRAYIGITEQKKLKVAIPLEDEPTEQSNIVASLDAVSEKLKSERQALRDLKSLKSGLMQDLLTGKVRVAEDAEERKEAVA